VTDLETLLARIKAVAGSHRFTCADELFASAEAAYQRGDAQQLASIWKSVAPAPEDAAAR
jgi:hypothetical protein